MTGHSHGERAPASDSSRAAQLYANATLVLGVGAVIDISILSPSPFE